MDTEAMMYVFGPLAIFSLVGAALFFVHSYCVFKGYLD